MKKLEVLQMENLQGLRDCTKSDAWGGFIAGAGVILLFSPAAPIIGLGGALLAVGSIYSGGRLAGLSC